MGSSELSLWLQWVIAGLFFFVMSCPMTHVEPMAAHGRLTGDVYFEGMECPPDRAHPVPPCSGPYSGYEVRVFSADGEREIASVVAGEHGEFLLELPEGRYLLELPSRASDRRQTRIAIEAGEVVETHLVVDTGA